MKEFWDDRYASQEYVYGELPNLYLEKKLADLPVGKALFAAEGEGRNAVYAATLGWDVHAFDQSTKAREKAMALAQKMVVQIDYHVQAVEDSSFQIASFDLLALIYAHFPANVRRAYHRQLSQYLKKGAVLIVEGFARSHVKNQQDNPMAGGPKDSTMLFDLSELRADFEEFEFIESIETESNLSEGAFHQGKANLVRILAKKK